MDCLHMNLIRVAKMGGDGPRSPSKDGVFAYYCKECHLTLYVKFTDAPPIGVSYGKPDLEASQKGDAS